MTQFTNVFGASGASHQEGAVPDPGSVASTSRFLREDVTWAVPEAGPPGPPAPAPGPALDQWACNAAGFIIYECCYKLVKSALDSGFFSRALDALIAFAFDSLAEILIPLELLDSGFLTWAENWVATSITPFAATIGAHILDQALWSKFHCFLYNEIRTAGGVSNTVLLAAGTALAASGIAPSQVTNGVALILQQFGIMSVGPVPLSAFVQDYDCSTCAGSGTSSAPIPLQTAFDLTVEDGTHSGGFISDIDFPTSTVTITGTKASVTPKPDLTITDGVTPIAGVSTINLNHTILSGSSPNATLTPELGFQHNGTGVGVEPNLDLVDSLSVDWTVTDDGAGSRMLLSGTVPKATSSALGLVKPDNVSTSVDGSGTLSALPVGGYPLWYVAATPQAVGSWTQVNTGGLTVAQGPGGPTIDGVLAQGTLALLVRPITVPYILVAGLVPFLAMTPSGGQPGCGMVIRDSATGHLVAWRFILNGGVATLAVSTFSSPTVGVANNFINTSYTSAFLFSSPPMWFLISNDGANRTYAVGRDGKNFLNLYSEAAGTYITEDQAGIFLEGTGFSVADGVSLMSWNGP